MTRLNWLRSTFALFLAMVVNQPASAQFFPYGGAYNYRWGNSFAWNWGYQSPYFSTYTTYNRVNYSNSWGRTSGWNFGPVGWNNGNSFSSVAATTYFRTPYGAWATTANFQTAVAGTYFGSTFNPVYYAVPNPFLPTVAFGNPYMGSMYASPNVLAKTIYNTPSIASTSRKTPEGSYELGNAYGEWVSMQTPPESGVVQAKAEQKVIPLNEKTLLNGEFINQALEQLSHRTLGDVGQKLALVGLNYGNGKSSQQRGFLTVKPGSIPWQAVATEDDTETTQLLAEIQAEMNSILAMVEKKETPAKETLEKARRTTQQLSDRVSARINTLGLTKYNEAKQFLKRLDESLDFLLDVPNYQSWKFGLPEMTATELAKYVQEHRLKVLPAVPGNEEVYRQLANKLNDLLKTAGGQ